MSGGDIIEAKTFKMSSAFGDHEVNSFLGVGYLNPSASWFL